MKTIKITTLILGLSLVLSNSAYSCPVDCVNKCCSNNCTTTTEITTIHKVDDILVPIVNYVPVEHTNITYQLINNNTHNNHNNHHNHNNHNNHHNRHRTKRIKNCKVFSSYNPDGTCVVDVFYGRDWSLWVNFSKKHYETVSLSNNKTCRNGDRTRYIVTDMNDCILYRQHIDELRHNRNNNGRSTHINNIYNYYSMMQPFINTWFEYVPITTYDHIYKDVYETDVSTITICNLDCGNNDDNNNDNNDNNGGNNDNNDNNGGNNAPVPEPSTMLLFGTGVSLFVYKIRKIKKG